jgi:hypothetical protein
MDSWGDAGGHDNCIFFFLFFSFYRILCSLFLIDTYIVFFLDDNNRNRTRLRVSIYLLTWLVQFRLSTVIEEPSRKKYYFQSCRRPSRRTVYVYLSWSND